MMTKAERTEKLRVIKERTDSLKDRKQDLQNEPIWDDTLKGKIKIEEDKIVDKIDDFIEALEVRTGKKYTFEFKEEGTTPRSNFPKVNLEDITNRGRCNQKDLITDVVTFCRNNGIWRDERTMLDWIKKVIDEV